MSDPKPMAIDFYQYELPTGAPPVSDLLTAIEAMTYKDRNYQSLMGIVRLEGTTSAWHQAIEGELIKIRMDHLGVKGAMEGPSEPLGFKASEGYGNESAFQLHPEINVLIIQRNRAGVSAQGFMEYLWQKGKLKRKVKLFPLLRSDAFERFRKMGFFKTLEVRIAGMKDLRNVGGIAVKRAAEFAYEMPSPILEMKLKMGHQRGSLPKTAIRQFVRGLMEIVGADTEAGSPQAHVQALRVIGKEETGTSSAVEADDYEPLDLLHERLTETVDVQSDSTTRCVAYSTRQSVLRNMWTTHRTEILSMVGS
jgi:hypothetical protein